MEKISSKVSSVFGSSSGPSPAAPDATVASIFIYPIKSCRGISVPKASVTPTGFKWDRQWVIVNSKRRGYTQRNEPKLALLEVELPKEAFEEDWAPTDESFLVLRAPGMEELKVPLLKSNEIADGVSVWEWSGSAYNEGDEAAKWLTDYLGKPSSLMRFKFDTERRPVDRDYSPGHNIVFSDCFPFMVASQGSLDALNQRLKDPVPINRFRPNILVDGCEPYMEDLWKLIKINRLTFDGVKLCSRCKVPTIDQETGEAGVEPTETMMKFRSDNVLRDTGKQHGKVYFGQNLVWKDTPSKEMGKVMKVGDPVYVLQKFASVKVSPA